MKKNQKIAVLLVGLLALTFQSCYNYKQVGFVQERNNLPQYDSTAYEEYRIRVNDQLIYRLMTTDTEMSSLLNGGQNGASMQNVTAYRVYPDGTIDIPFIPGIKVEGMTLEEAERAVEARFREILPDAEIKLALYNRTFTVIGEIGTGNFSIYKDKLTIFQALALSGDLTNAGDRKHVRIIRNVNGQPQVLEFDIRPNTIIDSQYYYVYPNDLIYVQRAKGTYFRTGTYTGFIGMVTSSLSLLISVLSYLHYTK